MVIGQTNVRKGMEVRSADGKKLGKVLACDEASFTIERGLFFPKDYVARYHEITSVAGDELRLALTKDELERARDVRSEVASPREVARTMTPAADDPGTRRIRELDPADRIGAPVPRHPVHGTAETSVERRASPADDTVRPPRRDDPDFP